LALQQDAFRKKCHTGATRVQIDRLLRQTCCGELALNEQVAAKYGDVSQQAENLLPIGNRSHELYLATC
jgi:hypothetical protein